MRARQVGGAKEFLPDGQDGRDGETGARSALGLSLLLPDHSEHTTTGVTVCSPLPPGQDSHRGAAREPAAFEFCPKEDVPISGSNGAASVR